MDLDAEAMEHLEDLSKLHGCLSVFKVRKKPVIYVTKTRGISESHAIGLSFFPYGRPDIGGGGDNGLHKKHPVHYSRSGIMHGVKGAVKIIIPVREYF
jgi:hypothetical protein